ncbi:MAG: hypothetical protein K2J39_08140 [Ruminococcus sp.]|nr:hypothetical protein [Ruminococcus sp.]
MNENEKDFMEHLTGLDDDSVEEIAEKYPALDENAKKRILKQSLRKSGFPDDDIEVYEEPEEYEEFYEDFESEEDYGEDYEINETPETEDEISVSGTEPYKNKISWHKYAGSAVAMLIAVIGIASVALLHRNIDDNEEFDISTPNFIETSYIEPEQITEIISGSYIDKGYRAGGFDYANINGYEGSIQYGMTTATTTELQEVITETILTTTTTTVTDAVTNTDANIYDTVPLVVEEITEDEPIITAPPETIPPVTTAPPVVTTTTTTTTNVITTTTTTTTTTVMVITEPATTTTVTTELPKTFISGIRYAEISGTGEYMGFEFRPDGTLTEYSFDIYGNIIDGSEDILSYAFTENTFSYGITGNESSWKKGSVITPYDINKFMVQFSDGLYTFSTESPAFEEPEVSIEGVWRTSGTDSEKIYTFHENTRNGSYIMTGDNTEITFTYDRNGNDIIFFFDTGDSAKATVNGKSVISVFDFIWADGTTEHFYSNIS